MNMNKLENVVISLVIPDSDLITLNGNQYKMNPNLRKLFKSSEGRKSLLASGDTVDAVLSDDIVKSLHKRAEGERTPQDTKATEQNKCSSIDIETCIDWALQIVCADAKTLEKDNDAFTIKRVIMIARYFEAYLNGASTDKLDIMAKEME